MRVAGSRGRWTYDAEDVEPSHRSIIELATYARSLREQQNAFVQLSLSSSPQSDAVQGRFVYQPMEGTWLQRQVGLDETSRYALEEGAERIDSIYDAESIPQLRATLDDVVKRGYPRVQRGHYRRPSGELANWEAVFLPVEADGRTMVFCHTVILED